MEAPIIAEKAPKSVKLEANKPYLWCTCGHSSKQPFCDGSHKPTDMKPMKITVEEDGTYYLCQCKQTGNSPFCDGTHNSL